MKRSDVVKSIVGMRFLIGGGSWLTPRISGKVISPNDRDLRTVPYWVRLFGVRDAALGAGLMQTSGEAQRQFLQLGVVCDAGDVLAALAASRRGELTGIGLAAALFGAGAATALGVLALTADDD